MCVSYDIYVNYGNLSFVLIFCVMYCFRLKDMDLLVLEGWVCDYVVGCVFGFGIIVESCILKRGWGVILDIFMLLDIDELVNDFRVEYDEDFDVCSMVVSIKCLGNVGM